MTTVTRVVFSRLPKRAGAKLQQQAIQPSLLDAAPMATDTAERIAHLEAIIASKRTNNGRAAWARAELKRIKSRGTRG